LGKTIAPEELKGVEAEKAKWKEAAKR